MRQFKTASLPSVDRTLRVLEAIAESQRGLTLTQLAERLGFPRSTVYCLLLSLERNGYVQRRTARGPYLPGKKIFSLCEKAAEGTALAEIARPHLVSLMARRRLPVQMALFLQGQVTLIAQFAPAAAPKPATWIGQRLDWHCTALGKALAAHFAPRQLTELIQAHGLPRHNHNTIVSEREIVEELALTRQRGYAVDDEEDLIGYRCVAAPVLGSAGEPIAAVSLMGTTAQIDPRKASELGADLVATAAEVSRPLGSGAARPRYAAAV
ncbi:MAG: IclR family transcriptional regulator [Bryobacterales bacterium]|nr:IclR family transcriptional regulator [Bryobacterales bacterium]